MKCLYLTSIEVDGKSAASNHVTEMINGMVKNQVDVHLVCTCKNLIDTRMKKKFTKLWFPRFKGGWLVLQLQIIIFLMFKNNYDFIYFRLSPSRLIPIFLSTITKPKIMELNGIEIINNRSFKNLAKCASKVLVSTESSRKILAKRYPEIKENIFINSNVGVSIDRFSNKNKVVSRKKLGLINSEIIFIVVSGFQSHHDFDTVLNAFSLFNKKDRSSKLILVGDGPRREEIEGKVKAIFKEKEVTFTGSLYIEEVSEYISAADICLNIMYKWKLSHHGNLNAQKTYEYMAVGRPIIETCISSSPIPSWALERMILINPESINELYQALTLVSENYDFYQQKYSSNNTFVSSMYSWDKIAENVIAQINKK